MKSNLEKILLSFGKERSVPEAGRTGFIAKCSERSWRMLRLSIALLTLLGAFFSFLAQRESAARRDANEVARMSRFSSFRCFRVLDI